MDYISIVYWTFSIRGDYKKYHFYIGNNREVDREKRKNSSSCCKSKNCE